MQDALSHYHAAVEGDPGNFLTYFKRGTVYLALGKAKSALQDFDMALKLKPDFHSGRFQMGLLLTKQGNIQKAREDFYHVYVSGTENSGEALDHYNKLQILQDEIDDIYYSYETKDFHSAIDGTNKIIEICPWSTELREIRAECHLAVGNTEAAIMDLKSITKLSSDNTEGLYKLSTLFFRLGHLSDSLNEVRGCLKLDPEHKLCFPHYKKVKKIDKFLSDSEEAKGKKDYATCINKAKKALLVDDLEAMVTYAAKKLLCHCYLHGEQFPLALQYCQEALDIARDPELHCEKAEAYIASEFYEEAIHEFNKALEIDGHYQKAHNGLKRAQKLHKQSEKRDYYKILNVSRKATKQEIVKAYRKMAQKWHPDNFQDGTEKKKAEKRFMDIAAAKEVLTDPEKREKYDNGEDPLDPESGHHQGFNPFQHFNQFQGSPFTFKFHFE